MIKKSCLVTDILPNNDICNKFWETWSEKIDEIYFQVPITVKFQSFYLFFWRRKKLPFYFLVKNLDAFLLAKNRKRGKILIFLVFA